MNLSKVTCQMQPPYTRIRTQSNRDRTPLIIQDLLDHMNGLEVLIKVSKVSTTVVHLPLAS